MEAFLLFALRIFRIISDFIPFYRKWITFYLITMKKYILNIQKWDYKINFTFSANLNLVQGANLIKVMNFDLIYSFKLNYMVINILFTFSDENVLFLSQWIEKAWLVTSNMMYPGKIVMNKFTQTTIG